MALVKTGKTPDGRNAYGWDGSDGTGGVIDTGPVAGSVTLDDGTVYDVTPEVIEHAPGHGPRIAYRIAKMHEATGFLTRLVHGPDYDGPCAVTVPGDEANFVPEGEPNPTRFAHSPECDAATKG